MVILTPMAAEYAIAKDRFGCANDVIWTGVGPRNILKVVTEMHLDPETPMMLFGFAGSNRLPIGTEVFVTKSYLHQLNASYEDEPAVLKKPDLRNVPELGVPCYSSSDFVLETKVLEPAIFDMELGFLTPFFSNLCAWRIVSDNLNLDAFDQFLGRDSKKSE